MAPFGTKVRAILEANNLTAEWLADQTNITKSTISDWMTKPDVVPRPGSIKLVTKALAPYVQDAKKLAHELAAAAGYTFVPSKDETEREARRREAMRADKRLADHVDRLLLLDADHQDEFYSFSEAWNPPTRPRRKGVPKVR